jgi:hypothetical protein
LSNSEKITAKLYDTDIKENDASNNFAIVACIHCHGKIFTVPLPGKDRGIYMQTLRLMGEIYEVRR